MKNNLITQPRTWHYICCTVALLACLPLLWPRMLPRSWRADTPDIAGALVLGSLLLSLTLIIITSIAMLLRLRNLRTLVQSACWRTLLMFLIFLGNPLLLLQTSRKRLSKLFLFQQMSSPDPIPSAFPSFQKSMPRIPFIPSQILNRWKMSIVIFCEPI